MIIIEKHVSTIAAQMIVAVAASDTIFVDSGDMIQTLTTHNIKPNDARSIILRNI